MRQTSVGVCLCCLMTAAVWMGGCSGPWGTTTPGLAGKIPRGEMPDEYNIEVYSLAAPDAAVKGKKYVITSAIKDVSSYDLEFLRVAALVEKTLSEKGFQRVQTEPQADLLVRLGYGLGEPQTTTNTYTTSMGYSYAVGWMWYTMPPQTQTVTTTKYTRNLVLEAYDLKDPNRQLQLWKTTLKSIGSQSDLRIVLPYMIGGAAQLLMTNMTAPENISILGYGNQVIDKKEYLPQDPFTPQPAYRKEM